MSPERASPVCRTIGAAPWEAGLTEAEFLIAVEQESWVEHKSQKHFTLMHFPPKWQDGSATLKSDPGAPPDTLVELLRAELGRDIPSIFFESGSRLKGADHRLQWQGAILPDLSLLVLSRQTRDEHGRIPISIKANSAGFSGNISFKSASFSDAAEFWSVGFSSTADFRDASFSGDAIFENADFFDRADFDSTVFSYYADFRGVNLSGTAYFASATFSGTADFRRAGFSGTANFKSSGFSDRADFREASYYGRADFESTTFEGATEFRGVGFSGVASFKDVKFLDTVSFYSVAFSASANFISTKFSKNANFGSAGFSGDANFTSVNFLSDAGFDNVVFSGNALFKSAEFAGYVSYNGAAFGGTANFHNGTIQIGSFDDVRFDSAAIFELGDIGESVGFDGTRFLEVHGLVRQAWGVLLVPVVLSAVSSVFAASEVSGVWRTLLLLISAYFAFMAFVWTIIGGSLIAQGDDGLLAIQISMRKLRQIASRSLNVELESLAHATEMKYSRLRSGKTLSRMLVAKPLERVSSILYEAFADYGRSIFRPFLWLFILVGGMAAAYFFWAQSIGFQMPGDQSGVWMALEFSWSNVFRPLSALSTHNELQDHNELSAALLHGIGETPVINQTGFLVRVVASLQSVLALVLGFLAGLAIRRRFQIN
ncbi:MAG: pentapeptide repeat-containing protein [Henriciella sp.]|nr:pentapeptide repeat-containing protein [Henriciella sp.]